MCARILSDQAYFAGAASQQTRQNIRARPESTANFMLTERKKGLKRRSSKSSAVLFLPIYISKILFVSRLPIRWPWFNCSLWGTLEHLWFVWRYYGSYYYDRLHGTIPVQLLDNSHESNQKIWICHKKSLSPVTGHTQLAHLLCSSIRLCCEDYIALHIQRISSAGSQ